MEVNDVRGDLIDDAGDLDPCAKDAPWVSIEERTKRVDAPDLDRPVARVIG
jgi:hypothetical protein